MEEKSPLKMAGWFLPTHVVIHYFMLVTISYRKEEDRSSRKKQYILEVE